MQDEEMKAPKRKYASSKKPVDKPAKKPRVTRRAKQNEVTLLKGSIFCICDFRRALPKQCLQIISKCFQVVITLLNK
jgi:hypothetical protein